MAAAADDLSASFARLVRELQDEYVACLERVDGEARFGHDAWDRPGGGGGVTRVLADGAVFERAAVNVSVVHGELSERMAARLGRADRAFQAAGLSVIIHPRSPMIPTVHMNVRRIEQGSQAWFGGGGDLTPYYLFADDARHFHGVLRAACDRYRPGAYADFKAACDRYFWLKHRAEARGIGGIFFDDLHDDPAATFALAADVGRSFLDAYLPIVARRRDEPWGAAERSWQCLRRGRYVEFNLVHDRGTLFGLETDGRTESILVSLPPVVEWRYGHEPAAGSREAALVEVLRAPRAWVE